MNYFTKEELEDITNSLLENPSRDTLKELNIKYNGTEDGAEKQKKQEDITPIIEPAIPSISVETTIPVSTETIGINPIPTPNVVPETKVEGPVPTIEQPKMPEQPASTSSQEIENTMATGFPEFKIHNPGELNKTNASQSAPLPGTPTLQNTPPLEFQGNIFESQPNTNNFTTPQPSTNPNEQMVSPNMNTNFNSNPFFGSPMPNGTQPNIQTGPSMFGQIMNNNQ